MWEGEVIREGIGMAQRESDKEMVKERERGERECVRERERGERR